MAEPFIDIVILLVYLAVLTAMAAVLWSVWRGWRCRSRVKREETIARHTRLLTAFVVAAVMGVALALGSSEPVVVGSQPFDDVLWLRMADMFVLTIAVQLVLLLAAMLALWARRKLHTLRR